MPLARTASLFASLTLATLPTSAEPRSDAPRLPPRVGGSAVADACPSIGVVVDQLDDGEAIPVHAAPGGAPIDTIASGSRVFLCDVKGEYVGVVYPVNAQVDCGVSAPIEPAVVYRGPCKSGWIRRDFVVLEAG